MNPAGGTDTASMTAFGTYRRLIAYSGAQKYFFVFAVLAMLINAAGELAMAWIMKPLLDQGFVEKDAQIIMLVPLGVIFIQLVRGIGTFGSSFSIGYIARYVIKRLRQDVFEKLLSMPAAYYDRSSGGNLVSKITYNIEQVAESSSRAVLVLLGDSLRIVALIGYMLWMSWELTIYIFILTPLLSFIVRWVSKRFRRYSTRIQNSMGDVTQVSEEIIHGHRVIKIFSGEKYERERFGEVNEGNFMLHLKLLMTRAVSTPVMQIIASFGIAAIIYMAARGSENFTFTAGDFTSYLSAMLLLGQPMKRLTEINEMLQKGIAAAESIFELLDSPSQTDSGTRDLPHVDGEVSFIDMSFAYDEEKGEVLRNINFKAHEGETIALVGRSGSGKSSLVNLIPRFYEPTRGRIEIDGIDIREVRLEELRKHIALVSQDIILFNDTIGANIAYGGLGGASDEEVREAARAAHALDFIEDLPEGFDTIVGDRGLLLSGGQRQRIAIARALLKDAPVLILDEATSALDTEAERHIQAALDELMKSRTTFVIAHRLSTIEKANHILVMENGEILEQGNHRELLEAGGMYSRLHGMQFADLAD